MQVEPLGIAGAKLITPIRHGDDRGFFRESYSETRYHSAGITSTFVQDNEAWSVDAGTLRGLHCQLPPHFQAKLVRTLQGRIRDVIVDARTDSKTFGQHITIELDAESGKQIFVPAGCLHGYLTLEPNTFVAYKVDTFYHAQSDLAIAWNDPDLAIDWQLGGLEPIVSEKDRAGQSWSGFVSPFTLRGVGAGAD